MQGSLFVNHSDPTQQLVALKPGVNVAHPINAKALSVYCKDQQLALLDRDAVMSKTILSMVVPASPLMLLIEAKDTNATWFPKYTDSMSLLFSMQVICSCYGTKHKHVNALLPYTTQHLEAIEAAEQAYYEYLEQRNKELHETLATLYYQLNTGGEEAVVLEAFASALVQYTIGEITAMERRIHAMFQLNVSLALVQSPSVDADIDARAVLGPQEYAKMRKVGETAFGVKEMLCGTPEGQTRWFHGDGIDTIEYRNTISRVRLRQYFRYLDVDNTLVVPPAPTTTQ